MKIVKKCGDYYVAFDGINPVNNSDTWSTSYISETIYIRLSDAIDFLKALGLQVDTSKLEVRE